MLYFKKRKRKKLDGIDVKFKVSSSRGTKIFGEHQQLWRDVTSAATRCDLFCIHSFFFFFAPQWWMVLNRSRQKVQTASRFFKGKKRSNDKGVAVFLLSVYI